MRQKIFIICLLCLLAGCTASSVAHLNSNPLSFDEEDQLVMPYWKFDYTNKVDNGYYLLQGKASLLYENMPVSREWIHNLRLTVYFSDKEGAVLASDSQSYATRKMRPETEVPFRFRLDPGQLPASKDIHVTFGYSMRLTDHRFHDARHERPLTGETGAYHIRKGPLIR